MKKYLEDKTGADVVKESESTEKCVICSSVEIIGKHYGKGICNICAKEAFDLID